LGGKKPEKVEPRAVERRERVPSGEGAGREE
jgi:hypothetical protein